MLCLMQFPLTLSGRTVVRTGEQSGSRGERSQRVSPQAINWRCSNQLLNYGTRELVTRAGENPVSRIATVMNSSKAKRNGYSGTEVVAFRIRFTVDGGRVSGKRLGR